MIEEIALKDCPCCGRKLTTRNVTYLGITPTPDDSIWFGCDACKTSLIIMPKHPEYFRILDLYLLEEEICPKKPSSSGS